LPPVSPRRRLFIAKNNACIVIFICYTVITFKETRCREMTKNTWFEETFLLSLENRMDNPKYPNQCILSERQADICEKYMKYDRYYNKYTYEVGTKSYTMRAVGRYTFLTLYDEAKKEWVIKHSRKEDVIATFDTEEEMQNWIDENVDEETGKINGTELSSWTSWTTAMRYKTPNEV
jgi:hypothetical protein